MSRHLFALLIVLPFAQPLAQTQATSVRPVVVFAPDQYRYGASDAVILRNAGEPDVIVLPTAQPTPLIVRAALDQLAVIRALYGEVATSTTAYRVDEEHGRGRPQNGFALAVAGMLRTGRRAHVHGDAGIAITVTPEQGSIRVNSSQ